MASDGTITQDVSKPDQMRLDSTFNVGSGALPPQRLSGFTMGVLDAELMRTIENHPLALKDPGYKLQDPFAEAVAALDTREATPATFDATPEPVLAQQQAPSFDVATLG